MDAVLIAACVKMVIKMVAERTGSNETDGLIHGWDLR